MLATDATIRRAQQRALDFLLDTGNGAEPAFLRWRDFRVFDLESDEWVTAYAAYALAETGEDRGRASAGRAWAWLVESSQGHGPGLGYHSAKPQDADATVWGCWLASAMDRCSHRLAVRSFSFLQKSARPDGGIATFEAEDLQSLKPAGSALSFEGWCTSHVCVTAAAAGLPGLHQFADTFGFLARTQDPQGFWTGYWWVDDEYATAHAIESLSNSGKRQDIVERALGWLGRKLNGHSPFCLALRILAMAKARRRPGESALRDLLAMQLPDGSWPASARLRIPPPNIKNPQIWWNWNPEGHGIGSIVVDQNRVFTTATALRALSACLAL